MAVPSMLRLAIPPSRQDCIMYRLSSLIRCCKCVWMLVVFCAGVSTTFPLLPSFYDPREQLPGPLFVCPLHAFCSPSVHGIGRLGGTPQCMSDRKLILNCSPPIVCNTCNATATSITKLRLCASLRKEWPPSASRRCVLPCAATVSVRARPALDYAAGLPPTEVLSSVPLLLVADIPAQSTGDSAP